MLMALKVLIRGTLEDNALFIFSRFIDLHKAFVTLV